MVLKDTNKRVYKQSFGPGIPFARMEKFMEPCLLFFLLGERSHGYEIFTPQY